MPPTTNQRSAIRLAVAVAWTVLVATAQASPRIVNGLETTDFPTVGAILGAGGGYPVTPSSAHVGCSGVLIGCRTFLTAAHCVDEHSSPTDFAVYLQHAGVLAASSVHRHPGYDGTTRDHDLAVVKLAEPVKGIQPSAFNQTHDLELLGDGLTATIVGFGQTGFDDYYYADDYGLKRFGNAPIADCNPQFTDGLGNDKLVCRYFTDAEAAPGTQSNTCYGDGGAPTFLDFDGSIEVAGVAVGGYPEDCEPPAIAIDVNVFHNADWIAAQLEGDSTQACGELSPVGSPLAPVHSESGALGLADISDSFRVPLQDDTERVVVTLNAEDDGVFDPDIFVRRNAEASTTQFDCAASGLAVFGDCKLDGPGAGFLSILVHSKRGVGRYQVTTVEFNTEEADCGNAVAELGEACDGADLGHCPIGPCNPDCTCVDATCGNHVVESTETCDDGNTAAGDGCNPSCIVETPDDCDDAPLLATSMGTWTTHGDTTGLGDSRVGCGGDAGDAWYRFEIDAPAVMSAETDGAFASSLSLYKGDCDGYRFYECAEDQAVGQGGLISTIPIPAGQYILIVDGDKGREGPFELTLSLATPGCGNGVRESGEACDGNQLGQCPAGPCQEDCTCPSPACGNAVRERGEKCDGEDLGNCEAGPCQQDCTCPAPICGNEVREFAEACDGTDRAGCGFGPCQEDCKCPVAECGNGVQESPEFCDGGDDDNCAVGPCKPNCTCPFPVCGNDVAEQGETCDGTDLGACESGPCSEFCRCPAPVCGNGAREGNESCDGADLGYCQVGPCDNDCTCPAPVCGDGIWAPSESCDGSNPGYCHVGPCSEDCNCPAPVCGNDVKEGGEACDGSDGGCVNGPCQQDCTCPPAVCGNGIKDQGENCDGPNLHVCRTGPCSEDCNCPEPVCGNDVWEYNEDCDGPDAGSCPPGRCAEDCNCLPPVCGNDIREHTESCDGTDQGYCVTGPCQPDCSCPDPVCGNDVKESGEACDDTSLGICAAGPCAPDCTCPAPTCGNDVREPGEFCDGADQGVCPFGPCQPNCQCPLPVCGNQVRESGEFCDGIDVDNCITGPCQDDCSCPAPVCGNLIRETDELCDGSMSTCLAGPCQDDCTCPPPVCGNNVTEQGEACDGVHAQGCQAGTCETDCRCSPFCGDSIVTADEECDLSKVENCEVAHCLQDCTCDHPVCGDQVLEGDEECDSTNLGNCPLGPCRNDCRCPVAVCGNEVREDFEACDGSDIGVCGSAPCEANCTCEAAQRCEAAATLPSDFGLHEVDGTTVEAGSDEAGCGGTAGEVWYRFRLDNLALVTATTDGQYDSEMTLFAGSCAALSFVDCNDDYPLSIGSRLEEVELHPGDYLLVVDGHNASAGPFTLQVELEPWYCSDADASGSVTSTDALRVLRRSVGLLDDCPVVRCDVTHDREVTASDALIVLQTAVGIATELRCPSGL